MIFNKHLDRLMEVKTVRDFMQTHHMKGKICSVGENHSFILYRLPYVVGFWDGSVIGCSVDLGRQKREDLRTMDFSSHQQNDIFLSDGKQKMYGLHTTLEAIDKLLPLIEAKGGLASMRDGSFDSRFDFSSFVCPIYLGLKTRYLSCISSA